eukprot:scaffold7500_cov50-Phaeocystis_antarctica.AAC.1
MEPQVDFAPRLVGRRVGLCELPAAPPWVLPAVVPVGLGCRSMVAPDPSAHPPGEIEGLVHVVDV